MLPSLRDIEANSQAEGSRSTRRPHGPTSIDALLSQMLQENVPNTHTAIPEDFEEGFKRHPEGKRRRFSIWKV